MAGDDLEVRQHQSGDSVFQQGDMGNEAYVVEKGIIEISRESGHGSAVMLNTIKRGKMFGEMALIDAAPRMATARAVGPTILIVIPQAAFQKLLGKTELVIKTVLNTVLDRLRQQTEQNIKKTL